MFEDIDMEEIPGLGFPSQPISRRTPMENDVTVHSFTCGATLSTSSSALLDVGREIAEFAATMEGWRNVRPSTIWASHTRHREYAYSLVPPETPVGIGASLSGIKEWGASPSEDEVFSINDLDEFEVTDISFLSHLTQEAGSIDENRHENSFSYAELYGTVPSPVLQSGPPQKHFDPSPDIDLSPLHKYIPEPRFLPPLTVDTSSAIQDRIPPFTKTTPTPIPPYTFASMQEKLKTPYTRGAWIIPIRGAPPWEGCTPANLIRPLLMPTSSSQPSSPALDRVIEPVGITWTRTSLRAFWTFLLHTRLARKLGHISLSFHACSGVPGRTLPHTSLDFMSQEDDPQFVTYPPPSANGRGSLLSIDHFKIYCDVEFALYVRSVLDAWFVDWDQVMSSEDADGHRLGGIKPKRFRPLEGAKLAFADEGSRGWFIS